jgi:hypothetical protein
MLPEKDLADDVANLAATSLNIDTKSTRKEADENENNSKQH